MWRSSSYQQRKKGVYAVELKHGLIYEFSGLSKVKIVKGAFVEE